MSEPGLGLHDNSDLKEASEYDEEIPQSQTAAMTPRGRDTEQKQSHDTMNTIKEKHLNTVVLGGIRTCIWCSQCRAMFILSSFDGYPIHIDTMNMDCPFCIVRGLLPATISIKLCISVPE